MGIVRDLYYARKMSAGLKLPAPTVALLIKRLRLAAAMGGGVTKTVSGSPAHITDALAKAALSVLVSIEPIQDFHGYSHPWPAGGWVNKLPSPTASTKTANGITISVSDGVYSISGTATASAEIIFDLPSSVSYDENYQCAFLNDAINAGVDVYWRNNYTNGANMGFGGSTNKVAQYNSSGTFNKVRFLVSNGTVVSGTLTVSPVMCLKTVQTPTSFTPYSNICPISGRAGLSVYRTGKNLYSRELSVYNSPVYAQDGSSAAYPDVAVWWIKVNPSTKYTISLGETPSITTYVRWINCDENKGFISRPVGTHNSTSLPVTITTPSGCHWVQIAVNEYPTGQISQNDWQLQIEEGQTATAYEAFGNTYAVDWSTQAGTVYGGTLDVVTGVLTVDMVNIPSYNGETINEPWLSSMDEYAPGATPTTGAQVVYKLATPLTYQLSAQEVQMLLGENYVWSSSGDTVSVTYYAEGNANPLQSLNILLGGNYSNQKTADDVSDKEALEIILGGNK